MPRQMVTFFRMMNKLILVLHSAVYRVILTDHPSNIQWPVGEKRRKSEEKDYCCYVKNK